MSKDGYACWTSRQLFSRRQPSQSHRRCRASHYYESQGRALTQINRLILAATFPSKRLDGVCSSRGVGGNIFIYVPQRLSYMTSQRILEPLATLLRPRRLLSRQWHRNWKLSTADLRTEESQTTAVSRRARCRN